MLIVTIYAASNKIDCYFLLKSYCDQNIFLSLVDESSVKKKAFLLKTAAFNSRIV